MCTHQTVTSGVLVGSYSSWSSSCPRHGCALPHTQPDRRGRTQMTRSHNSRRGCSAGHDRFKFNTRRSDSWWRHHTHPHSGGGREEARSASLNDVYDLDDLDDEYVSFIDGDECVWHVAPHIATAERG
eukprot:3055763-Prymnesium_polylepis.1